VTYRDELEAERARIEALEGENKRLRADLERAHETPAAPKPAAPVAAGVVTKRAAIKSAVIAVLGFGAVLVGFGVLLVVTRTRIHGVVTASPTVASPVSAISSAACPSSRAKTRDSG
jgi:hypothetical protein